MHAQASTVPPMTDLSDIMSSFEPMPFDPEDLERVYRCDICHETVVCDAGVDPHDIHPCRRERVDHWEERPTCTAGVPDHGGTICGEPAVYSYSGVPVLRDDLPSYRCQEHERP